MLNGVAFECDLSSWPGRTMARGMFFGTFSIEIVAAMKRFLKTGDVFIDVGANIGYLSAVGMGLVGPSGEVHSFEPVPDYYSRLRKLAGANPGFRFFPQPIALSDTQGRCTISVASKNVGWNTLVPGFMRASDLAYQVEVQTDRLDSYIDKHNVQRVSLIKIDTEGFEFPVLRGLKGYFERGERPPIICEVATDAYGLLGYSISDFHEFMSSYGYRAYRITQSVKSVSSEPFDIRNARGTIDVVWTASSSRRISRLSSVLGAITE
jgi:FkbM family methyltransferase